MSDESGYLALLRRVLDEGERRDDRTGVGTISLFAPLSVRYDLRDGKLPIFTTKKVVWDKGIRELLWYISGGISSKQLEANGVNYWKWNTSREFLDARGLRHYEVGELGPSYGHQWRHWGAPYSGVHVDYSGEGIDQLQWIIDEIKRNPTSRRLILSAWNVSSLDMMCVPPCHMLAQFYVSSDGNLDCQLYQRSADLFLGVPLNVLCYSLLTHMIADVCGLKARYFIHAFGDAHIYTNHVDAVKTQLSRSPYSTPSVNIVHRDSIDDYTFDDFEVVGYRHHPFIKAPMAI